MPSAKVDEEFKGSLGKVATAINVPQAKGNVRFQIHFPLAK